MSKDTRIGALWRPNTDNEKAPFAKGKITVNGIEYPVVVWFNRWKHEGEKTPDYYIDLDTYTPKTEPAQGELGATQTSTPDAVKQSARDWQANRPRTTSTMQTKPGEMFKDEIPWE